MTKHTGGCACRAVRYEISADPIATAHCHCRDCQQATGTGHATMLIFPKPAVTMTGTPGRYPSTADSGRMKTRGFCTQCGSPLFVLLESMPDAFLIRAASLDDPHLLKPQMVLYTDRAPAWDHVDPSLPRFAKMPPA